jgi:Tripartite ATP-independent periplasmic transporter, DctM component
MHPPFGFALFYLRSVAPAKDFVDRITGRMTPKVTTGQIYWGAVPFVVIQVIMVAIVIAFPGLVTGNLETTTFDPSKVKIELPQETPEEQREESAPPDFSAPRK